MIQLLHKEISGAYTSRSPLQGLSNQEQGMNGVMDNRHGINILWHGEHRSKNQVYFTLHILELPEWLVSRYIFTTW